MATGKFMGKVVFLIGLSAMVALTDSRAQAQGYGTSTNGDITAKGNLTVEGGTINGSGGSAAISLSGSAVDILKDTLRGPSKFYLNSPGEHYQYKLEAQDLQTKDDGVLHRLMIRPEVSSQNQTIAIGDSGWSGDKGIVVKDGGFVGIGSIDDLTTKTLRDALYISGAESIVFHEGGSKAMLFNAHLNAYATAFSYLTNNPVRSESPAGAVQMDYLRGLLQIWTAPQGGPGADILVSRGMVIDASTGNVGVNLPSIYEKPQAALDLNGCLRFRRVDGSVDQHNEAMIWADSSGHLVAKDASGNRSTFSPHIDPRTIDPQAQTSFGDTTVNLPYSFHHENAYIGKGEVIDMAKLVKYVEEMMKKEKGDKAGQLIYSYDLPTEKCRSEADYEVQIVVDELQQKPVIEVEVGADGKIPPQAFEEVDEIRNVTKIVEVPEKKVDFGSGRVVAVMHKTEVTTPVRTGRKVRRFRNGWSFENGKLYRRTTVDDLDLNAIAQKHPKLPQWVLERMKNGRLAGQSVSGLVDEIKKRMASIETTGRTSAAVEAGETTVLPAP